MPAVMSRKRSRRRDDGRRSPVSIPPQCRSLSAVDEPPEALGAGGRHELELDAGARFVKTGDGLGQDDFAPHRVGRDTEGAGAPREGGFDVCLGGLDLVEDPACGLRDGGAERSEAHPVKHALKQPAADLTFQPGDDAGERGLRHGKAVGRDADPAGLGNGEESDEIAAFVEHCAVSGCEGG